jgi:uncharacterized protein (DUF433 family)
MAAVLLAGELPQMQRTAIGSEESKRMPTTVITHIWLDNRGVPWIDDTNTKVIEVVSDTIAHGWSPEEIHFQHPHLSLAQIHAALGYYYDHKKQMDDHLQRSLLDVERRRAESGESPIRKRLREIGTLG